MTRLGTNPGPGPAGEPVVLWSVDVADAVDASPLIAGGLVIAADGGGTVRALDASTGTEAWATTLPAAVAQTPTISGGTLYLVTADGTLRTVRLADQTQGWTASGLLPQSIISVTQELVIAGAPGEMVAFDVADGKEAWRAPAPGSDRSAIGDSIVLASGSGSDRITALASADGTTRWTFDTGTESVLTPGVVDGNVLVVARGTAGGRNIIYALDAAGRELWHAAGPDIIGSTSVAGGRVFATIDQPHTGVNAYDQANGQLVWQRSIGGPLLGVSVEAGGRIYAVGGEDGLVAVDAESGAVAWRVDIGPAGRAGLAISGGLAIVTTRDADGGGRILALAGVDDPRVAGSGAPTKAPTQRPTAAPVPLSIVSTTPVDGRTLLLSTAIGPDGTMYVGDMRNSRIVVRAPDGTIESWGEFGSGPGEFNFSEVTRNDGSVGVAVSPDGALIAIGDSGNHRVQLFDADQTFLRSIGRLGREDGQFINPCCVSVDAEHRVWVVDTARADVQVFSAQGEHLSTFGAPGHGDGQLNRPGPAFIDLTGDLVYIADFGNRRVAVFSTDGTWVRSYEGELGEGRLLDETNHVVLDRFGRLLIVDTTSRLFILEPSGEFVGSIGNTLPEVGLVEYASFAVDADGRVYLADIGGETHARLIVAQLEPPLWPGN